MNANIETFRHIVNRHLYVMSVREIFGYKILMQARASGPKGETNFRAIPMLDQSVGTPCAQQLAWRSRRNNLVIKGIDFESELRAY